MDCQGLFGTGLLSWRRSALLLLSALRRRHLPTLRRLLLAHHAAPAARRLRVCLGPAAFARAWAAVRSRAFVVPDAPSRARPVSKGGWKGGAGDASGAGMRKAAVRGGPLGGAAASACVHKSRTGRARDGGAGERGGGVPQGWCAGRPGRDAGTQMRTRSRVRGMKDGGLRRVMRGADASRRD